jgi:hypothetical protein
VVAVNIKLFQQLRDAGEAGVSSDVLVSKLEVKDAAINKHQLDRILRHLKASNVIESKGAGVWCSTPLSNEFAEPHFQESILFCHYVSRQAFNGYPEYYDRITKEDSVPGPFQIGMGTKLPFFEYLATHPPHGTYFNSFMRAYRAGNTMWFDPAFYPVTERLVKGFEPTNNEVFIVDVGGGRGHDIHAFAAQFPDHPGKLLLQDQPSVIKEVPGVFGDQLPFELQGHNFFTPETVKYARAYVLHSILHDWGDEDCMRILENLKPALKPGYSKVLFNEIVLSEENPSIAATSMDMMMLAHCDPAYERTESAWRKIIEGAGYKVVAIFNTPGAAESVIEAEIV